MNRFFTVILIAATAWITAAALTPETASAQSQPTYRYFTEIGFDDRNMPYANPRRELRQDMTSRVAHYRFRLERVQGRERVTQLSYYDSQGRLTNQSPFGVATINYEYDARGRRSAQAYFNEGSHASMIAGVHRIEYTFDNAGRESEIKYLNINRRLVEGIAVVRQRYLPTGEPISVAYFDAAGNPVATQDRVHEFRYTWEADTVNGGNRLVEERRFDTGGNLTEGTDQAAIIRMVYDATGKLIARRFLNRQADLIYDVMVEDQEEIS